ncbi:hypothetical protein [Kitasatospora sp. NPDC089509]|uniref:hypothetical protein n=1 Tax=Kitasatospora sp. NPDC089509 TaxID=3364079 RepID=UPI0038068986
MAEQLGRDPRTVKSGNNVARWESGTVPELPTCHAIAAIHGVSQQAVKQHGWPNFLNLANHNQALSSPWTFEGTLVALNSLPHHAPHTPSPEVTGRPLMEFARKALSSALDPPARTTSHPGPVAEKLTRNARDLHDWWRGGDPLTAYDLAQADLGLTARFLTEMPYDDPGRPQLLLVASFNSELCRAVKANLGEHTLAERYGLLAVRTAALAGSPLRTATALANLAAGHAHAGNPRDAFALNAAARSLVPRPTPRLEALISAREAHAHARMHDSTSSLRALDRATEALTIGSDDNALWNDLDEQWLAHSSGRALSALRRHKQALEHFNHLLRGALPAQATTQPLLYTANALQRAARTQLAIGEVDAAAHSVIQATTLFSRIPSYLTQRQRQAFRRYSRVPAVRSMLDLLAEKSAPG